MSKLLHKLPRGGPLERYRRKASFDWKKMRILVEGEEVIKFKEECWKAMEKDPLFIRGHENLSFDEYRRITALRVKKFKMMDLMNIQDLVESPYKLKAMNDVIFSYDGSVSVKFFLAYNFVQTALMGLGTQKHMYLNEALWDPNCELVGSFSLTEISHGTNTKKMRTTATFDVDSQTFVLNTPDFEAAKCWVGNLGKTATHTIVFAKLILPDGRDCGLHSFIIPIRDPNTFIPYPGVKIGDLGPKVGLNGADNGFLMFNNYRVSKDNLLNKNGDVTEDGEYVTPIKDPSKRFGASLGALSAGRVGIIGICQTYLTKALTISIRYSAVRKQFGPNESEEIPVIEYPMQQWRLFRYLACAYALNIFSSHFYRYFTRATIESFMGDPTLLQTGGSEIHGLSSAAKPLAGWLAQQGIQESREACGGHGYLQSAGLGDIRNDNDANLTYEGDNNVLLQQTSNWLLGLWSRKEDDTTWDTPLKTVEFLKHWRTLPSRKCKLDNADDLLAAYEWLIWHFLDKTAALHTKLEKQQLSDFDRRNHSQVYAGRELSIVYAEYNVLRIFWNFTNSLQGSDAEKSVLKTLVFLYGGFSLEKHFGTFYAEGSLKDRKAVGRFQSKILESCGQLKDNAVSLVDAIAPPDFCLNSTLGSSDGEVYSRMESALVETPGTFGRPTWWKDLVAKM